MANSTEDDWDDASPLAGGLVSSGDDEIRVLRASVRNRFEKEHIKPAPGNVGGEHLAGSAKIYSAAVAPTKRPDSTSDAPGTTLDATDKGRLWYDETTLSLKRWNGTAWVSVMSYALLSHSLAAGTAGGTITANTWTTRPLNTEDSDVDAITSLPGANVFRLQAGKYRISVRAAAEECEGHQLRLYNTTDAAAVAGVLGTLGYAGVGAHDVAHLVGEFTLAAQKDLRVEHNCKTTKLTNGMGTASTFTGAPNSVHMIVELWKLSP